MGQENISGQMVQFMKENGKIIRYLDLVLIDGFKYLIYKKGQMVEYTQESG